MSNSWQTVAPQVTGEDVPLTSTSARWGASILIIAFAIALNFCIQPVAQAQSLFVPFLLAVLAAAYFSGAAPAFVTLVLAALAAAVIWMKPSLALGVFLLGGGLVIAVCLKARHLILEAVQTRARFDRALTVGRMVTWEWDVFTGKMAFSEGAQSVFGWTSISREELYNTGHPEDLARVRSVVNKALESGREYTVIHRIIRPDTGELRWIETSALVHRTNGGRAPFITGVTIDVTERQLALEASREAEQRERQRAAEMSAVLEVVPAAVLLSRDRDCSVVTGSRMAYDVMQVPRGGNLSDTLSGQELPSHPFRVLDSQGRELKLNELPFRVAAATGEPQHKVRLEAVLPDGERRFLFGNADPLIGTDGVPMGAVAAFVDISELVATERALRESEALYHTLADRVPNFVWAADPTGKTVYVNRPWEEFTGQTLEQIREQGWLSLHHPDERQQVSEEWILALKKGEPLETEFRYRRHDGVYRWIWGRSVPVKDVDGRVTKWVGTCIDVTERLSAEAEARRLASVIEGTPDFVAMSRPDGHLLYLNVAARNMLGIPLGADIGEYNPAGLCPAWVDERARKEWLPEALKHGSARGEGALLTLDRNEIPVAFVILAHRDERGGLESVSIVGSDISARKCAEDQLQQESRRKDEFLATLAHELRNPMAPIRYAAAMLREDAPKSALKYSREVIERQSAVMSRLLDDLLDMSRITRGLVELKRMTLDLRDIVRQSVETVRPTLVRQRQQLTLSMPEEPLWVDGDSVRLLQVIGNLLDNSAKYTGADGKVDVSLEKAEGKVVCRVKDTGIGLSPEMLTRVFDLFARVHGPLAPGTSGLGIGLTVVKQLVELHGGTIEVSSAGLDKGTQFTMQLPSARAPVEVAAVRPDKGREALPYRWLPRVLVVDDNRDAAESLATLLRSHEYPVNVAFDGTTALAAVDAAHPDVLLLDMGLPDMRGEEVACEVRRKTDSAFAKIIAITGWGQEADRRRSLDAGIDVHLVKPVDPRKLLEILGEIAHNTIPEPAAHPS
jgi:PAS domain S-box-containing protein